MDGQSPAAEPVLPASLAELVRTRIGDLEGDVREVLLAAACVAAPTVDLLARGHRNHRSAHCRAARSGRDKGIIGIDGNRVRFTPPAAGHAVSTPTPVRRAAGAHASGVGRR